MLLDPLEPGINRLVIRECLTALFLNPELMNPDLNVKKNLLIGQHSIRFVLFSGNCSSVFKKPNLGLAVPASRG